MYEEPLTIEVRSGKSPETRILQLTGPLTIHNVFPFQEELRKNRKTTTIIDLTHVPYMDSTGMGAIINYYVSCRRNGCELIVAAPNYRVVELFKLTKVDSIITVIPAVPEIEG